MTKALFLSAWYTRFLSQEPFFLLVFFLDHSLESASCNAIIIITLCLKAINMFLSVLAYDATSYHDMLPQVSTFFLYNLVSLKGVASEDDMFLFGRDGCSHFGPDLYATLRVSPMNALFIGSVRLSVKKLFIWLDGQLVR